mmetsp:Transcript_19344/g.61358  ORF Transcript_19344/g.61358 Transcript_19344/m.61358 type:complete len:221 (+) Transcript_19344:625-1287(+)
MSSRTAPSSATYCFTSVSTTYRTKSSRPSLVPTLVVVSSFLVLVSLLVPSSFLLSLVSTVDLSVDLVAPSFSMPRPRCHSQLDRPSACVMHWVRAALIFSMTKSCTSTPKLLPSLSCGTLVCSQNSRARKLATAETRSSCTASEVCTRLAFDWPGWKAARAACRKAGTLWVKYLARTASASSVRLGSEARTALAVSSAAETRLSMPLRARVLRAVGTVVL